MKNCKFFTSGGIISIPALFLTALLLFGSSVVNTGKGQAAILVALFGDKIATETFHTSIDCGLTLSTMPGIDDTKWRPGIYFGLGTFVKLSDTWALLPEFKPLSRQGARNIKPFFPPSSYPGMTVESADLQMNYIDIPVLLQHKFKKLTLAAGPQISFLTRANQISKGTNTATGTTVKIMESCFEYTNPIMFAFPVEVGLRLPPVIPGKDIDLKIRYSIGLTDILVSPASNPDYGSSRGSTFEIFISFPFVKKGS
jgi:hypothetical protein